MILEKGELKKIKTGFKEYYKNLNLIENNIELESEKKRVFEVIQKIIKFYISDSEKSLFIEKSILKTENGNKYTITFI